MTSCASYSALKISDIPFVDRDFKRCVLAQGKQSSDQITVLNCHHYHIRNGADLRYFHQLEHLDLSANKLQKIDVQHNRKLQVLSVEHNHLTEINVRYNKQLRVLNISFNRLKTINLKYNPLLMYLNFTGNFMRSVDIRHNPRLISPFKYIHVINEPTIGAKGV